VAAAPAPHQPGFGGGTAAPAGDTAPAIPVAASRDDLDARVGRSLLYSGALGLALAVIGMTMVARRRRLW